MPQKIGSRTQQLSRKKEKKATTGCHFTLGRCPNPQLHADLVIDTGKNQWSTTWPTRGLGHRLSQ